MGTAMDLGEGAAQIGCGLVRDLDFAARCLSSNSLSLSRVSKFWTWRLSILLAKGGNSLAQRASMISLLSLPLSLNI